MTFGARPEPAVVPEPVHVGDTVLVLAGRNHGARAVVMAVDNASLRDGSTVVVARIRRPRGGESWEFMHTLRRIEPVP